MKTRPRRSIKVGALDSEANISTRWLCCRALNTCRSSAASRVGVGGAGVGGEGVGGESVGGEGVGGDNVGGEGVGGEGVGGEGVGGQGVDKR